VNTWKTIFYHSGNQPANRITKDETNPNMYSAQDYLLIAEVKTILTFNV